MTGETRVLPEAVARALPEAAMADIADAMGVPLGHLMFAALRAAILVYGDQRAAEAREAERAEWQRLASEWANAGEGSYRP